MEGKQTKLPHDQHHTRAIRPLQLVHSDLMGPIKPTSYDGKKYIITFIDDYTHFTAGYIMENKSDVFEYFKIYEAMSTAHFNCKISRFHCDDGIEYISDKIAKFFQVKEIQYEFTKRYTPQQNGVAERMNRNICEKARCLILNSKFGKEFWSEAVLTDVYLINRMPTAALKEGVPATIWYGEKTKMKKIKVFGCLAYLHLPKELVTGKFDSRIKKCFMVDTVPTDTGYGVRKTIV